LYGTATNETIGWLQRDGTNEVVTQVLSNLEGKSCLLAAHVNHRGQSVVDGWDGIVWILDVDHRAIYSCDAANATGFASRLSGRLWGCCFRGWLCSGLCGWLLFGFGHVSFFLLVLVAL
jgi:hypothetical protein